MATQRTKDVSTKEQSFCFFILSTSFFVCHVGSLTFFFPKGFDLKFSCNIPTAEVKSYNTINAPRNASHVNNNTSVSRENPTSSEKKLFGAIVSLINVIFAFYCSCRNDFSLATFTSPQLSLRGWLELGY